MKQFLDFTIIRILRYIQYILSPYNQSYKTNLYAILREKSMQDASIYVQQYVSEACVFEEKMGIWNYTINKIKESVHGDKCLEFGVWKGESINYFSKHLKNEKFYGFDSFFGLAEDWSGQSYGKGSFNLNGKIPRTNKNVKLISGFYDKSIEPFVKNELKDTHLKFIHIDSDTYEAAKTIFEKLKKNIYPGTLILFDDYFGYLDWRNGEYKALNEFCENNKLTYKYLAFCNDQALVQMIDKY
tara:strand:+ start:1584 stop:2309 length:726 start_codon:yes stop_codon:yes gene_type:complete